MDYFNSPTFDSHVEDLMGKHHVPGLAIAILHNSQTATKAVGKANVDPPQPCTPDTLFDIASSSKVLTAASVALLIQNNQKYPEVQWDAVMSQLLPDDFVMSKSEYTDAVTVEDILSHRSGIPGHDQSYLGTRAAQTDDARSVTRNLRNLAVAAPIRTKYMYCNMMYTVATHLVEEKTKQKFSDFLFERIFKPLKMHSTSLQPAGARAKGLGDRVATGHNWNKKTSSYDQFKIPDCPEAQGAGSIVTSVTDFIRFVEALMYRKAPISKKVYKGLVRPRIFANPNGGGLRLYTSPEAYAAGLEIYWYRGYQVIGHDGCIDGSSSRFFFLPHLQFGAVIFGNSDMVGHVATKLEVEFIDEILGIPETDRQYRKERNDVPSDTKDNPARKEEKDKEKEKETSDANTEARPQLDAYVGDYFNSGYHSLTVQIKEERLFIDATDRSFGISLTFPKVSGEGKYKTKLTNFFTGEEGKMNAEFVFKNGKAARMGLDMESDLKELIWFEKVDEA